MTRLTSIFFHESIQILFDSIHDRHNKSLKQAIEKGRLFLIFLEDKADPISYFFKRKFIESFLIDSFHRITMFMNKINAQTLRIFNKSLFFLHKKISILCHPLIYILTFPILILPFLTRQTIANKIAILKYLISFLKIKELTLKIVRCHVLRYFYMNINLI